MIPNMSDHLDNQPRLQSKSGPYDITGDASLQTLFTSQLIHAVDPNLLQGGGGATEPDDGHRHELLMEQVREGAERAKAAFIAHMDSRLKEMWPVTTGPMERGSEEEGADVADLGETKTNKRSEKQFVPRKSLLTELVQNKNIQTVNNIFVAILFVILLNSALMHLLKLGSVGVTFEHAFWVAGKVPFCLYIWCQMMLWVTAVFYGPLSFWAHHPDPHCGPWGVPNLAWLALYGVVAVGGLVVYPPLAIVYYDLPFLTSLVVLVEQFRLFMKMHAFLRVIVSRAMNWKREVHEAEANGDAGHVLSGSLTVPDEESPCPDFSLYLYYLFAPTLIYQDSYPMTDKVRWKVVRQNVFQWFVSGCYILLIYERVSMMPVMEKFALEPYSLRDIIRCCSTYMIPACLFIPPPKLIPKCFVSGCYIFLIYERVMMPTMEKFALEPYSLKDIIRCCSTCMVPACLVLFLGFYTVLHCWLNAAAEMMRFADRQFYKDWWNASSFAGYYRDWNIVVHCWLYNYVYKDLRALGLGPKTSLVSVFLLSALAHEAIVALTFRFCFPVLFILFGFFGVIFLFIPNRGSHNVRGTMLWLVLFIGSGILACLYSFEWFSRKNCPSTDYAWYVDIFIPRTFFCHRFQFFR